MSSERSWFQKFAVAISGVIWALRSQNSFLIHLPMTAVVIGVAAWLQVEAWRWAAVVLAITIVLSFELLNSSIEQMIKVLHPEHDAQIGRALDAAAGAVLIASIGAVVVGLIALAFPLCDAISARF